MARSYEENYEQNKDKVKEEFRTKQNAAPDENTAVQKREKIKFDNHLEQRIQEKMLEITEERGAPQPAPSFAAEPDLSLDAIHREAIRRVQSETIEEKKEWTKNMVENTENRNQDNNIEQPKTVEEVESDQEQVKPERAFKAKIHQIVDEAQKHRSEASRTFVKNRRELLTEAEKQGAENPAREVATAQREVHKIINANEHKSLHALFQQNGWDYDKQGVQFIESETNTNYNTQEYSESAELVHSNTQGEEQ